MKLVAFLFFLFPIISLSQIGVNWQDEIIVADGAQFGKLRPRMALNRSLEPVIAYGSTNAINVSKWNGSTFVTPQNVLPAGMQTYISGWTGPDCASGGDTILVVFKSMPLDAGHVYAVRSTDGGQSFSDTIRVDNHQGGIAWMPSVDVDDNGDVLVSYMVHDANWSNPRYVLAKSTDAGLTYTSEISVITSIPGETCDCCPSEVIKKGNRELLLFRNNDANTRDIHGVLSLDNGGSFPYQENVDNSNWNIAACPSTGPHGVFEGNNLITTYASSASGNSRIYISQSDVTTDLSYQSTYFKDSTTSNQNYPRIDNATDTIVLAWREFSGPNSEIYVAVSTGGQYNQLIDNGVIANQTIDGVQTNPDIKIENGFVHLCYQDDLQNAVIYRRGSVQSIAHLDNIESKAFQVFPNPSQGVFKITDAKFDLVQVLNEGGIQVKTLEYRDDDTYSLEDLSNGVYFIEIISGDRLQTQKLILRK